MVGFGRNSFLMDLVKVFLKKTKNPDVNPKKVIGKPLPIFNFIRALRKGSYRASKRKNDDVYVLGLVGDCALLYVSNIDRDLFFAAE